jgi:hypothetical protein
MNEEFNRPPAGDDEDEELEAELAAGIEALGL